MSDHQRPIFVYGTLMSGESAHALLAPYVQRSMTATLSDVELYDLGAYPVLVTGVGTVYGELYWLADAKYDETLRQLDRYEGTSYERRLHSIAVNGSDSLVEAWVYVGRDRQTAASKIECGDWRRRG